MLLKECWMDKFREQVYFSSGVLDTKIAIHELYSTKPTDVFTESASLMRLKGDEKILDVGCGTANFLLFLREERSHEGLLIGIDIAKGGFENAPFRHKKDSPNMHLLVADVENLVFSENMFDIVTAFHMLSHLPEQKKPMKKLKEF